MSARSIRAALNSYLDSMATQVGCIAHQRVSVVHAADQPLPNTYLLFTPRKAFPLANRSSFWLTVAQTVHLESESSPGKQSIEIIGYFYRIGVGDEGSLEVLAYHFDPFNRESGSPFPHLHIGRSAYRPIESGGLKDFHKRHIPTGHVTFPMVVRFLIEELGVEPLNPNWNRVLAESAPA